MMTLNDLTHDEQVALAALVELAMMANGAVSAAEEDQIEVIMHVMGEERFRECLDEAETRFPDRQGLEAFLETVTRQEARELIYGTVLTEALLDTLQPEESRFLDWLAQAWGIRVRVFRTDDLTP